MELKVTDYIIHAGGVVWYSWDGSFVWSNYVAMVSNGGQFPFAAAFAAACTICDRY